MKNRLKENIMLIVLCIVIIRCTVSINNRIDEVNGELGSMGYNMRLKSGPSLSSIEYSLDNIESSLHSIDMQLDGSLDDILYYMPKS